MLVPVPSLVIAGGSVRKSTEQKIQNTYKKKIKGEDRCDDDDDII